MSKLVCYINKCFYSFLFYKIKKENKSKSSIDRGYEKNGANCLQSARLGFVTGTRQISTSFMDDLKTLAYHISSLCLSLAL